MHKNIYQNILAFFSTASKLAATPEIVGQLCPHLSKAEVKAIIAKAEREKCSYYFAMPPLLIDNVVGVACIEPASKDGSEPQVASISFVFAQKVTPKSVRYSKRALNFARRYWGDSLVTDKSKSYVTICVKDPTKLDDNGSATTTTCVHFTTARNWQDLLADHSAPQSQLINNSILHITSVAALAMELGNEGGCYGNDCCCAHCGGGLFLTVCTACNHNFEDDGWSCGWNTPLPEKIVSYLVQHGHQFAIDPAVARHFEAAKWSQSQSIRIQEEQAQRIIDLKRQLELATAQLTSASEQERKAKVQIYQISELLHRLSDDAKDDAELRQKRVAAARRNSNRELIKSRKEAKKPKKAERPS